MEPDKLTVDATHIALRMLGHPQAPDVCWEDIEKAWSSVPGESRKKDEALRNAKKMLSAPKVSSVPFFDDKGDPDPFVFAEEALKVFPTVTFRDNEETWVYMDGRYCRGNTWLREYIDAPFREKGKVAPNSFVSEVMGSIQRRSFGDRELFGKAEMLCLQNGTYDFTLGILRAHDPENRLTYKLPIDFDPKAKCERWLEFLLEAVPDERDRNTLQEVFGYVLQAGNPHQLMVMLIGPKRSGKSTILRVMEALLGPENVSHQTLQALSSNRFSPAHLYGKMLNTFADLPVKVVKDLGILKTLSGEDTLDVERKGKDFFRLTWGGKAIFSCNELPSLNRMDEAFFRRWLCIGVPNVTELAKVDPDLTTKLLKQLPGIFNWALDGRSRLALRGRFDPAMEESGIKGMWLDSANPMRIYVRDRVVTERGCEVPTERVYEDYLNWTTEANMEALGKRAFTEAFWRESKATRAKIVGPGGKDARGFRGIRLRVEGDSPVGQTVLD